MNYKKILLAVLFTFSALIFLLGYKLVNESIKSVEASSFDTNSSQKIQIENELEWTPPPRDEREPGFWEKG